MDNTRHRLTRCFRAVFPDLRDADIRKASTNSVANWDSLAGFALVKVVEEEFAITVDLDRMAELDSFEAIESYLSAPAA